MKSYWNKQIATNAWKFQ